MHYLRPVRSLISTNTGCAVDGGWLVCDVGNLLAGSSVTVTKRDSASYVGAISGRCPMSRNEPCILTDVANESALRSVDRAS